MKKNLFLIFVGLLVVNSTSQLFGAEKLLPRKANPADAECEAMTILVENGIPCQLVEGQQVVGFKFDQEKGQIQVQLAKPKKWVLNGKTILLAKKITATIKDGLLTNIQGVKAKSGWITVKVKEIRREVNELVIVTSWVTKRFKLAEFENLELAATYDNIGGFHAAKGKLDKALEFHQKALAIRLKQLGPDHPDVALSYNNIGGVHLTKGELDKALEFYQKTAIISRWPAATTTSEMRKLA